MAGRQRGNIRRVYFFEKNWFIIFCVLVLTAFAAISCSSGGSPEERKLNSLIRRGMYGAVVADLRARTPLPENLLAWLRKEAEKGNPVMQLEMSHQLVTSNPTEAAAWFATAHLGSQLDAAMCADKTARAVTSALVFGYPDVAQLFKGNPQLLASSMEHSLDWHKKHPERPSPLWACYHAVGAVIKGKVELIPEDERPAMRVAVIDRATSSYEKQRENVTQNEVR